MRNFGFSGYDNVIYPGTNGKMPEISAAMGLVNLHEVEQVVMANQTTFEMYDEALGPLEGISLLNPGPGESTNYQYVVALVNAGAQLRDQIVSALHAQGILARRYFWPGVHRMEPYASLRAAGAAELPATEWVADRVIVLPGGPGVRQEVIDLGGANLHRSWPGGNDAHSTERQSMTKTQRERIGQAVWQIKAIPVQLASRLAPGRWHEV